MTNGRGNWQERALGPGQYTRTTLAIAIGVSRDTVVRWQSQGLLVPIDDEIGGYPGFVFGNDALETGRRLKGLKKHNIRERVERLEEMGYGCG